VVVDVRPSSPTYLRHVAADLHADSRRALYVPEMFANGYQTLSADTEVMYQVSEFYAPDLERGLRFDDPALGIDWPLPVAAISAKDASWPLLLQAAPA
jgi:dTDP-4-dehydrorhamnose 3,5-epimerase